MTLHRGAEEAGAQCGTREGAARWLGPQGQRQQRGTPSLAQRCQRAACTAGAHLQGAWFTTYWLTLPMPSRPSTELRRGTGAN